MKFTVIIATYNRFADLRETLSSLAKVKTGERWEVIIVDNNSTDQTAKVIKEAAESFPVELIYLFEGEQGRSAALNAGIRASRGEIIVTTDDDVRIDPSWLDCAASGLDRLKSDYIGGRVLPIWGGPRPNWLPERSGRHWAVLALLDYGPEPIESFNRALLGVNMAFRRNSFERAGLFDNRLGRKAGTLLGQEIREWCRRARSAGLRGSYTPDMLIHHIVPVERLEKKYFRHWFYWRGISRAILYKTTGADMEAPERTTLDFSQVPHIAGVPRYMYRNLLSLIIGKLSFYLKGDKIAAFEHEMQLCFYAGLLKQRWKDRKA